MGGVRGEVLAPRRQGLGRARRQVVQPACQRLGLARLAALALDQRGESCLCRAQLRLGLAQFLVDQFDGKGVADPVLGAGICTDNQGREGLEYWALLA